MVFSASYRYRLLFPMEFVHPLLAGKRHDPRNMEAGIFHPKRKACLFYYEEK